MSHSGFYAWRRRTEPGPRAQARAQLDKRVAAAFQAGKSRYGSPRITAELAAAGYHHDRKTVARSLRRQGLRARAARRFKATTDSRHGLPVAPNLLEQDFTVGDITYLWTEEGWLYLAVDVDLYSRRVVGWAMHRRMTAELACDALMMALWRRRPSAGLIVHTDRGSQYCSVELIHGERFSDRCQMRKSVFEYIEVDYNRTRRHSALHYVSPEVFESARAA